MTLEQAVVTAIDSLERYNEARAELEQAQSDLKFLLHNIEAANDKE